MLLWVLQSMLALRLIMAAGALALVMVLAAIFHARRGEMQGIVFNVVLLALAAFVLYGRYALVPLSA